MSGDAVNLADPDVEPTDQQLIELSRRAFAGLAEKREAAFETLLAEIERHRDRGMKGLDEPRDVRGSK